jgi:hypothetical protein
VPTSSLRAAITHLDAVAKRKSYGHTETELAATAAALETVTDWVLITQSLTEKPVAAIAQELGWALESGTTTAEAASLVTQFWFGVLLARSGLRPAVPPAGARRPDFVIQVGTPIAVEVKRPQTLKGVMRNIKEAARQIRDYGQPGFVAADLSLALGTHLLAASFYDSPRTAADMFGPVFVQHARAISDRVHGYKAAGKFGRVLGLLLYARVHAWHRSDPSSPLMSIFVESPVFPSACAGLMVHVSERVRVALRAGVSELAQGNVRALG